jgi:UTP:GlnB (protein PII) uridylyltransferase
MYAHHATATAPARTRPPFDAPLDPWLMMRMAPVAAHRRAFGGATARAALRAIARARPEPATLAVELGRVRALLDRERGQLRRRLADGAPADAIARAGARLLDGTVIGLCHLGRLIEPRSAGTGLSVIARGDYGRRMLAPATCADLVFLMPPDPARLEPGLALARFVARALAGLGWPVSIASRTVRGCLAETLLDPRIASDLAAARLVWGARELFAELRAGIVDRAARPRPEEPARTAA